MWTCGRVSQPCVPQSTPTFGHQVSPKSSGVGGPPVSRATRCQSWSTTRPRSPFRRGPPWSRPGSPSFLDPCSLRFQDPLWVSSTSTPPTPPHAFPYTELCAPEPVSSTPGELRGRRSCTVTGGPRVQGILGKRSRLQVWWSQRPRTRPSKNPTPSRFGSAVQDFTGDPLYLHERSVSSAQL